ncbi:hypothetical protein [Hymenobacter glacialis]|uniref:Uncharacterized protein n=1 Tax=Hymenobacter glacialis TaxID=1908236 RepID=A0A1G1T5L7_9BACT|nr:hypothetical protein [Hymenobacter glacialis]OGX86159.1 hypothetical protein BEN48_13335 [Hymenobacter glacialis]
MRTSFLLAVLFVGTTATFQPAPGLPAGITYPWLRLKPSASATVAARFPVPAGCQRVKVAAGSWGEWLR